MQLIIDSEPALALEKDMSAIEDIGKVGNGNIEQLCEKNCNGNKENIGEGNTNTNDQIKQNNDTDVEPEAQIEIKSFNTELENGNGLKCKETKSNSAFNDQETKESQSNNCNGKSGSSIVSTEESIKKNQEVIDCESDVSKVNNTDQNNDSAEELTIINNETSTVIEQTISEELASANSIEKTIDNIKAATNNIEMATDNVEVATDTTEGTEAVNNTINVNKSESDTDKTVDTEVPLSSPKDDVEVIEESAESENANKSNENLKLPENDKKDDESTMTVDITDAEPIAVILGNEPPIELKDDMDVEVIEETKGNEQSSEKQNKDTSSTPSNIEEQPIVCKLSNTLDILSDDEEEAPKEEPTKVVESSEKQCINIEDDDDIMLIDEDTSKTETPPTVNSSIKENDPDKPDVKIDSETGEKPLEEHDLFAKSESQESKPMEDVKSTNIEIDISEKQEEEKILKIDPILPLIPDNFLTSAKKNIADMTREDLEEFCILKIVESIVDRSSLSDIKLKLKSVAQGVEEYRKKITMLTKQNLDLQVVLKSIQEEQKKAKPDMPITPLKITRSVGMQVFMEKSGQRRKNLPQQQQTQNPNGTSPVMNRPTGKATAPANANSLRLQKPALPNNMQNIPVPRLVPANNPAIKSPSSIPLVNQTTPGKAGSPLPNGVKNPSPQKVGEKRQHNRVMAVTVDLTDDEPPAKVNNRTSPAPPVRVVPSQNLMAAPRQSFPVSATNSPRKVYIPISGQQNQNIRPGQTIMLKTVPSPVLRPKGPSPQVARIPSSSIRMTSNVRPQTSGRHPAPLPDVVKQYQPPNWKALPPAPEIKLSKVENGIVISWKIESYQEDCHEEIASYQLYAYQETSCPPSTTLWKKIGDVKALPLPMACTLTQFMAGFKYYFAVRAVDIRSRLGPFSLPGSILLLNKL